MITDHDIYLFKQGRHYRLHDKLGAHPMEYDGETGTRFALWAPNARSVHVIGAFNHWDPAASPLRVRQDGSGIWEGFIPGAEAGQEYKFRLEQGNGDGIAEKGDPFAVYWERAPRTASKIWDLDYDWNDEQWMRDRREKNGLKSPMSIYEVHLGSWRRSPDDPDNYLDYRTLAHLLADYVLETGFTHVEIMPIMEHPFYGSWGYQTVGYFAPTSRYGTPQDFMYMVDHLHQKGIGVILDWVPSHFPTDGHGLYRFDGTCLFEHEDVRKGFHPDWHSSIFNYGRYEVQAYLISSALFWLDTYHVDGLRVDAVASMIYLDYSRKDGEWIPNQFGGNENLEALEFLRRLNTVVYEHHPDVQTIAEESTSWPMVSHPVYVGGLGFGMKWNMGWMNDTLSYMAKEPVHRKFHQDQLTFSIWYAYTENFLLPLSHDEVVHQKGSLLDKMPGDPWQKMANLRLLFGYMFGQPGKKLIFMGGEIGQWREWNHESSLDWNLLDYPAHRGIKEWVKDLNRTYAHEPALHAWDYEQAGFSWEDCHDADQSVLTFFRKYGDEIILVACNFTPVPRHGYRVGLPLGGTWKEILNSDGDRYGGSNAGNGGGVEAMETSWNNRPFLGELVLPPLSVVFFKPQFLAQG
ncbi:1,4-alpha-glucan branching protein GlgB [Desulfoplanes sp.]